MVKQLMNLSVLCLITVIGSTSCQSSSCGESKKAFLSKFERFLDRVDELDLESSDEAWEKHDETFRQYVEECYDLYEKDLSTRERRRFWMKSLKYYSTRYGEGLINELSKEDAITNRVEENIRDVIETTGRDLEDFVNKNMDEIEDLVNDIGKDIEEWASKLKEIFEE